jgi:hypothetical protein
MRDRQDFDAKVRRAEAEGDDPPERAHRRILAVVLGAVVGYGLGAGFVVVVDRARYSGADSDLLVWLVGLPTLLAIAGGDRVAGGRLADGRGRGCADARGSLCSATPGSDQPARTASRVGGSAALRG